MKSRVLADFRFRICLGLSIVSISAVTHAADVAECEHPPGGSITCEKNQMARCEVRKGEVYGRCSTPPANLRGQQFNAWILSRVLNTEITAADAEKPENQMILRERRVVRDDAIITFGYARRP
jgi:hypothetical protein